jgi:CheY-like chemotaxis protein
MLVVDDDRRYLLVLGRGLRALGNYCWITTVQSGQQALDYIRRIRCDVLVTDLLLGGLGGAELAEAIRRRLRHRHHRSGSGRFRGGAQLDGNGRGASGDHLLSCHRYGATVARLSPA